MPRALLEVLERGNIAASILTLTLLAATLVRYFQLTTLYISVYITCEYVNVWLRSAHLPWLSS